MIRGVSHPTERGLHYCPQHRQSLAGSMGHGRHGLSVNTLANAGARQLGPYQLPPRSSKSKQCVSPAPHFFLWLKHSRVRPISGPLRCCFLCVEHRHPQSHFTLVRPQAVPRSLGAREASIHPSQMLPIHVLYTTYLMFSLFLALITV